MTILALVPFEKRAVLQDKLMLQGLDVAFIENPSEITALNRSGKTFSVAILPATLPDAGMWALWGQVRLLSPRPEIVIYTPSVDFATWSGVLEAGGHDILIEPFSAQQLLIAITKAQKAFDQRIQSGMADEVA
jgi:DNA-binding NtrC family response regulator